MFSSPLFYFKKLKRLEEKHTNIKKKGEHTLRRA